MAERSSYPQAARFASGRYWPRRVRRMSGSGSSKASRAWQVEQSLGMGRLPAAGAGGPAGGGGEAGGGGAAVGGRVGAVVAAEAAGRGVVAEVARIGAPEDVHLREDVAGVDVHQSVGALLDGLAARVEQGGGLSAVEVAPAGAGLAGGRG